MTCACSSGLPVHAAHATLHATASRLGLRTEGRSIQKIGLPSSDPHGTLFMRLPISPAMTPRRGRSHMRQGQHCCWVCPGSLIGVLAWPLSQNSMLNIVLSNGQSPADIPDGCRLNEFFERPPPCVGVSGKHHARLIRECRWKSTTVALQTGCDAVGNRQDWQPTLGLGKKKKQK